MIAHMNIKTGEEQSVSAHCKESAAIAAEMGRKIHLKDTALLLAVLHDLGKLTVKFEEYIKKAVRDKNSVRRGEVNHTGAGAIFVHERYYRGDDMHRLTAQLLSIAIYSHHGLFDIMSPEGKDILSLKIQKKNEISYEEAVSNYLKLCLPLEQLDKEFEKAVTEITDIYGKIKKIIAVYSDAKESRSAKYFYLSCLQRLLLSVLIDADRLNTAIFCGERLEETDKFITAGLWDELYEKFENELKNLSKSDKISLLRSKISEACLNFANNKCGIYKLMVPTGGGKTLSSLRYALAHAKRFHKERIFYIAPFMSILDQNADVIKKILHRDDVILEHHSNVMNGFDDESELNEWRHLTENWDSPIILTTMVQFLNTLFDGRTQCIRRMHNLSDSVIIFDEIQSLPAKSIHIFNLTVNFLSKICNSTIILCSATQPLLDRGVQYKLLLEDPDSIILNVNEVYSQFKRVKIINRTMPERYDSKKLSGLVMEIMNESDNVLIIMNTKKAAENLYIAVKESINQKPDPDEINIVLLTTHMCPKHRLDTINEIKDKLGKDRIICISTSLIEAGVDISFDCVIRSLAGLDSIAQAAGRCNRNGKKEIGKVYIINSKEEDLSKLQEIKKAQNSTEPILNKYKAEPEYFLNDLLSPFALEKYYERYFRDIRTEMNYKLKDKNTNIFDLLSVNETGVNAFYTNTKEYPKMLMNQAYKTAGEEFEVIVNQTIDVIVPYNDEAKELIAILEGNSSMDDIKNALRKVQRYTVNLFFYEYDRLEKLGGIHPLKNAEMYALMDGFYSNKTGITENAELGFLSI